MVRQFLLPIGTYKTDTGVTFRVDEEGIVAEVMETETEEEVEAGYDEEKEEMAEAVELCSFQKQMLRKLIGLSLMKK